MKTDHCRLQISDGKPGRSFTRVMGRFKGFVIALALLLVIASSVWADNVNIAQPKGQKTKAQSIPVTMASDQGAIPTTVTGGATEAKQDNQITALGAVTETAPATDTASSGLNGRLQRLAQRLTSLIALLPTSLGQKTKANSFAVTVASDQDALATATAAKQYTGVPSTFTVGTTDQTVFTLAAGEIGFIQNLDDAPLMVKKGASASPSSFSFVLAAGTAADDGKGGATGDELKNWVGAVSVAAGTGSPRYIAWKQAP